MFDAFVAWVKGAAPEPGYVYSRGMWVETPALANIQIAAVHQMGGPSPDVDDRRIRYRVILMGARNDRAAVIAIENDIHALAVLAMGDALPCGASRVRAIGEPVGPGYTNENRAWYSLDLEVLF